MWTIRPLVLGVLTLTLTACDGGGAPAASAQSAPTPQPANVAGLWDGPAPQNAAEARLDNCTIPDPTLNGSNAAAILSTCFFAPGAFDINLALVPRDRGVIPVTQSGNVFTITKTNFVCVVPGVGGIMEADSAGVVTGGGTLTGNTFNLQVDFTEFAFTVDPLMNTVDPVLDAMGQPIVEAAETDFFTGSVAGNTVTLNETHFDVRGGTPGPTSIGGCDFQPPLVWTSTIIR